MTASLGVAFSLTHLLTKVEETKQRRDMTGIEQPSAPQKINIRLNVWSLTQFWALPWLNK